MVKYAGFWRRFAAYIVDSIIMVIAILIIAFGGTLFASVLPDIVAVIILAGIVLVSMLIALGYHTYFLIKKGATPGKEALGLVVVDENLKYPISTSKALVREIAGRVVVDGILGDLPNLLILFDSKKQSLHDKIGGTYVVFKDSLSESPPEAKKPAKKDVKQ